MLFGIFLNLCAFLFESKKSLSFKVQNEETVDYYSDFRYESNGIFVLGVGFFFFRQISTF